MNCAHLESYDPELYRQLVCYPQEVIPTFDMAINEMFFERYPAAVLDHQIQVRPFNAEKTKNMRSLNPEGEFPVYVVHVESFVAEVSTLWKEDKNISIVHKLSNNL
jgi:DNA replicative helicase MCM subunit Mcm2 (Cdc46/Mcm family)